MDFTTLILTTAKTAHVSGALLLAVCSHESANFTLNYSAHDNGSPSFGVCQLKFATALALGFSGKPEELMDPKTNVYFAAQYLQYQQSRYGVKEWCKQVSAYNSGTYNESEIYPGFPKNLKYVRLVQRRLPKHLQSKLSCGPVDYALNKE